MHPPNTVYTIPKEFSDFYSRNTQRRPAVSSFFEFWKQLVAPEDTGDTSRDRQGMTWPDSGTGCKSHIYMVGTSPIRAARTPTVSSIVLTCKHTFPSFLGVLQVWFELIPLSCYHSYSSLIGNKLRRTLCLMKLHLAFNSCGFVDVTRSLWVIWLFQPCLNNCLLYGRAESHHSNIAETRVINTLYN